ncbi:DASS family sodium-coupled anion symporter [Halioxenophilus sp. WMMB6]|uniref:SLC13 family permease n=1 Tax=Halioxenophilus sp. WMMB6 TaxID=3073815 RepID=UPI00295F561C|nr:DASS family sodium-coupled anion symporter [Halioxenophilus sp. WMMB6]
MRKLLIVLGLLAAGVAGIEGLLVAEPAVKGALIILWVAAVLWLTEAIHVTATALIIPVLAAALHLMDVTEALQSFAHPIIYIFLGGYGLAAAMNAQKLDLYLAHGILSFTGGRLNWAVILLCLATSLLSMWISNMATAALMLPLVLGLLGQKHALSHKTKMFCLLGIAYSANLGGIATLVGSAPNGITAAALGMSFGQWLQVGGTVYLLLWPLMMVVLWWLLKPDFGSGKVNLADFDFAWSRPRLLMVSIFLFTVVGWVFSKPLGKWLGIDAKFDTWVALTTLVLLMLSQVVTWKQIQKHTDWGILLLFGGGLALGALLKSTGASVFLGTALSQIVAGQATVVVILVLVTFVVFLTELTSNTATTALLVPIFITLPEAYISHQQAALAVGITASCAFMLPVATPPNALVHGTGLITGGTMLRAGLVLNIVCVAVITAVLAIFY